MLLKTTLAASGHMKDENFTQYQHQLARQASGGEETRAIGRPASAEEMRMLVRQLGLGGFKVDIQE